MARNPNAKPDKDNSPWVAPTSKRQSPAAGKDHTKDDPKRAFTDHQSFSDKMGKKLFGGK